MSNIPIYITTEYDGTGFQGIYLDLDRISESTKKVESTTTKLTSTLGRMGASAFIIYDRIEIAALAVENAQNRLTLAQERLTHAIEKHGAGSREAVAAQLELENSTRSLEIAQQREMVRLAVFAGLVLPQFIAGAKQTIDILGKLASAHVAAGLAAQFRGNMELWAIGVATLGIGAIIGAGVTGLIMAQQQQTQGVNVFGDINVHGVQGPGDFAEKLKQSQTYRTGR